MKNTGSTSDAASRSAAHETPVQWSKRRLRFDARLNPLKSKLDLEPDTEVSFVPMDAVGEFGGLRLDETRALEEIYNGYTYFADGDVCLAKITPCFENGKGALAQGLTNGVAFGTTELHIIRPLPNLDAQFLFYLTIAHDFRSLGEAEMLGAGGQKRVPEGFLKDWRAPLPPLETQRRIAKFLDSKTAQIDALINKKSALLDRLAEKRQALITHAVTKGLNPDAQMKDSCVDWLGDIPAQWDLKPLRHLGEIILGLTYSPADVCEEDEGRLVIRSSNVRNGRLVHADDVYVSCGIPQKIINCVDDIIVCSRNGSRKLIGKSALVTDEWVGCTFGAFMTTIRSDRSAWIRWALSSSIFEFQSGRYMSSTINQLTTATLKSFAIPVPPRQVEKSIVDYLETTCARLDALWMNVTKSIDGLTEYRSALITAAVTGQLDLEAA